MTRTQNSIRNLFTALMGQEMCIRDSIQAMYYFVWYGCKNLKKYHAIQKK